MGKLKKVFSITFFLLSISLSVFAQEDGFIPPEEEQNDPNLESETVNSSQLESEILSFLEPYIYDEEGRRDPFEPYSDPNKILKSEDVQELPIQSSAEPIRSEGDGPLGRYDIKELKLRAVLWSVSRPRALVLAPDEKTYVLIENDSIGNSGGYVAKIRESEVVVVEKSLVQNKEVITTKILRLNR